MVKEPSGPVVASRTTVLSGVESATWALGMTEDVVSVTVPETLPWVGAVCAWRERQSQRKMRTRDTAGRGLRSMGFLLWMRGGADSGRGDACPSLSVSAQVHREDQIRRGRRSEEHTSELQST